MRALTFEELGFVAGGEMPNVDGGGGGSGGYWPDFPSSGFPVGLGAAGEVVVVRGDQRSSGGYNWNRLAAWGIFDVEKARKQCSGMSAVQARATDSSFLNWAFSGGVGVATVGAAEIGGAMASAAGRTYVAGLAVLLSGAGQLQSGAIQLEKNWIGCS